MNPLLLGTTQADCMGEGRMAEAEAIVAFIKQHIVKGLALKW